VAGGKVIWFYLPIEGRLVAVPRGVVRRVVKATRLAPDGNPYWGFSNALSEREVMEFLRCLREGREPPPELGRRVAYYITFYAENLVLSTYMTVKALCGEEEAEDYLGSMEPVLEELRSMLYRAEREGASRSLLWRMLQLCIRHGMDPF